MRAVAAALMGSGSGQLSAFLFGLKFDLAVAAIVALIWSFLSALPYRLPSKFGGHFLIGLLVIAQFGDLIYVLESGGHVSYEIFDLAASAGSLAGQALAYPGIITLALITLVVAMVATSHLLRLDRSGVQANWLAGVLVLLVTVIVVRGGLTGIAMNTSTAQGAGSGRDAVVALNGAYSILFSLATPWRGLPPSPWPNLPDAKERVAMLQTMTHPPSEGLSNDPKRVNVVFILLESWPAHYMKSYGGSENTTPFFDQLRTESLTTEEMLANGKRTTEGMFSVFCSYPVPNGRSVARTQVVSSTMPCLPRLLREKGWSSAFFQGSNEHTAGTGNFARALGFAESYGKADIRNKPQGENAWGVFDADLYTFATEHITRMSEPFVVGINTNTTHDLALPANESPRFPASIPEAPFKNAMASADSALETFIRRMRNEKFKLPVVFVLVADHTTHTRGTLLDQYRIPFLMNAPGLIAPKKIAGFSSQRDIAPTLMEFMGTALPGSTGQSLFRSPLRRIADASLVGRSLWIEGEILIDVSARPDFATSAKCYRWRTDAEMSSPVLCDTGLVQDAVAWHSEKYRDLLGGVFRSNSRSLLQ